MIVFSIHNVSTGVCLPMVGMCGYAWSQGPLGVGWACLVPGPFWDIPEDVCQSGEGVDMPEGGQRTVPVLLEGILVLLKFENKLNTIITARRRSFGQGNIFYTCLSFCSQGGLVSQHAPGSHYIRSCTGAATQLVWRQHTGNIKCMMG